MLFASWSMARWCGPRGQRRGGAELRSGDFELTIGCDLSIAYQSRTDKAIRLYPVETMAFCVPVHEAAVALAREDGKGSRKG
jgi:hypothetical protein